MENIIPIESTTSFMNLEALQASFDPEPVEPDYYVRNLERFGIICYKQMGDLTRCFAFAWQITADTRLFIRFDERDRHFIQSLARRERKDSWYQEAGKQLRQLGFEKFTE